MASPHPRERTFTLPLPARPRLPPELPARPHRVCQHSPGARVRPPAGHGPDWAVHAEWLCARAVGRGWVRREWQEFPPQEWRGLPSIDRAEKYADTSEACGGGSPGWPRSPALPAVQEDFPRGRAGACGMVPCLRGGIGRCVREGVEEMCGRYPADPCEVGMIRGWKVFPVRKNLPCRFSGMTVGNATQPMDGHGGRDPNRMGFGEDWPHAMCRGAGKKCKAGKDFLSMP